MMFWIFAVLTLFFVQTLLPSGVRYLVKWGEVKENLSDALGPRDNPPEMPRLGERAARALHNMTEALPFFLTFALLTILKNKEAAAVLGAQIFFWARVAYVPSYLLGIPVLRSALWIGGWVGMALMVRPLLA